MVCCDAEGAVEVQVRVMYHTSLVVCVCCATGGASAVSSEGDAHAPARRSGRARTTRAAHAPRRATTRAAAEHHHKHRQIDPSLRRHLRRKHREKGGASRAEMAPSRAPRVALALSCAVAIALLCSHHAAASDDGVLASLLREAQELAPEIVQVRVLCFVGRSER